MSEPFFEVQKLKNYMPCCGEKYIGCLDRGAGTFCGSGRRKIDVEEPVGRADRWRYSTGWFSEPHSRKWKYSKRVRSELLIGLKCKKTHNPASRSWRLINQWKPKQLALKLHARLHVKKPSNCPFSVLQCNNTVVHGEHSELETAASFNFLLISAVTTEVQSDLWKQTLSSYQDKKMQITTIPTWSWWSMGQRRSKLVIRRAQYFIRGTPNKDYKPDNLWFSKIPLVTDPARPCRAERSRR